MRSGRVPRWAIIGVACTIAGVVIGFAAARWTSAIRAGSYQSPGNILVSADQRTLSTSAGGGCINGSLVVRETPGTVVVKLLVRPQGEMNPPGVCALEVFSAKLHAPLGSRQLIDGITGARLPSFRGEGILRPAHLPPGFVHRYDAAFLNTDTVVGASAGSTQVYTQGDSYDESIWISQIKGGRWLTPAGISAKPIFVRGQPGLAINGEIEWRQGGQLFIIQSVTYAYATVGTPELIAIADSLR